MFLYGFPAILSSPNKSTSVQLLFNKGTLVNGNRKFRSKSILLGPNRRYIQICSTYIFRLFLLDLFNALYLSLNRLGKRIESLSLTKM